jgi:hypothetical protein
MIATNYINNKLNFFYFDSENASIYNLFDNKIQFLFEDKVKTIMVLL